MLSIRQELHAFSYQSPQLLQEEFQPLNSRRSFGTPHHYDCNNNSNDCPDQREYWIIGFHHVKWCEHNKETDQPTNKDLVTHGEPPKNMIPKCASAENNAATPNNKTIPQPAFLLSDPFLIFECPPLQKQRSFLFPLLLKCC